MPRAGARSWWMAGFAAYVVAYAVAMVVPWWGTAELRETVANVAAVPTALVVALFAWSASRPPAQPATRRAWRWIAASYVLYWGGDVWWFYYETVLGRSPAGSWTDVPYVASFPVLLVGLLSFPYAQRSRADRVKAWLDVATVVCAGALAVWYYSFAAAIHGALPDVGAIIATLGYPVGDLVILTGVATLWSRRPAGPLREWSLTPLAAGMALTFVADLAYA